MRYGFSLKELVERYVPQGTTVGQTTGGDDGTLQLASMAGELQNVQEQGVGGAAGKAIVKQAGKYAERAATAQLAAGELTAPDSITVCGSGNLGQIYFDLYPRRIKRNELDEAYPGLVAALAAAGGAGRREEPGREPLLAGAGARPAQQLEEGAAPEEVEVQRVRVAWIGEPLAGDALPGEPPGHALQRGLVEGHRPAGAIARAEDAVMGDHQAQEPQGG